MRLIQVVHHLNNLYNQHNDNPRLNDQDNQSDKHSQSSSSSTEVDLNDDWLNHSVASQEGTQNSSDNESNSEVGSQDSSDNESNNSHQSSSINNTTASNVIVRFAGQNVDEVSDYFENKRSEVEISESSQITRLNDERLNG